jgi:hypothetical protein
MAVRDELYKAFLEASGRQSFDFERIGYALASVISDLGPPQASTLTPRASSQKTAASSSTSTDSVFDKVLKSGLGISPLIGGLVNLFSGDDSPPPPLLKYALPPSIAFQAAEAGRGFASTDYGQAGQARVVGPVAREAAAVAPLPPQITVNVSAMDARSFLDRSGDIALAVRDAMLNLNSINDVVNDL